MQQTRLAHLARVRRIGVVCEVLDTRRQADSASEARVDRHAGNYGFLVENATGEILRMAPLFDHNMACLPMMMETDDFDEYISLIGPKIDIDVGAMA